jgi:GH15 family glucan-1,4-alpha-glucosidase
MLNITGLVPKALDVISKNTTKDYGIVAATKGPGMNGGEYLHIWPRDSIFIVLELMKSNKDFSSKIAKNLLSLPTNDGLFYQRYELDGSPDPDGWCNVDGRRQLDQDAMKFVLLAEVPSLEFDREKLKKSYFSFIGQIKNKNTSFDVWEQKSGYFFYSTATIIWGLKSVNKIFPELNDNHARLLSDLVDSLNRFFDEERGSFVKDFSERIVDLEVVLGLNVLFDAEVRFDERDLDRILSTLKVIEEELTVDFGDYKVPLRYKGDFWNGEVVGESGIGRPWPMGTAMISQLYANCAKLAGELGKTDIEEKCLEESKRWLEYVKKTKNIEEFPEQVKKSDGSIPDMSPRPLTWCAAEVLKAERLFFEAKVRNLGPN